MKGWSERNLRNIRNWYLTYSQYFEIRKQVVSKLESSLSENETTTVNLEIANPKSTLETPIASNFFSVPWGHHVVIMQKCKDLYKAVFYIEQTLTGLESITKMSSLPSMRSTILLRILSHKSAVYLRLSLYWRREIMFGISLR